MIIISIIECIYLIYMLNFFKTHYSLAHPLTYFNNDFLRHPIGRSDRKICHICPLGNIGAYIISFFIIVRLILIKYNLLSKNIIVICNKIALIIIFLMCLLNFNALFYLIPFFILEGLLIFNDYNIKFISQL